MGEGVRERKPQRGLMGQRINRSAVGDSRVRENHSTEGELREQRENGERKHVEVKQQSHNLSSKKFRKIFYETKPQDATT